MKTKKQLGQTLRRPGISEDSDVRQEIDKFLRALSSYPDRFAREPYLSFQQHLSSMVSTDHQGCANHSNNGDRHRSG